MSTVTLQRMCRGLITVVTHGCSIVAQFLTSLINLGAGVLGAYHVPNCMQNY